MKVISLMTICFWLFGCASTPAFKAESLETARQSLAKVDVSRARASLSPAEQQAQDQKISQAFGEMMTACKLALAGFETRAHNLRSWKIAIATTGALVGGVAVPALTAASATGNAVWISSLGGLSGVANVAQQTMAEEGMTSTAMLQAREQILADWKEATSIYFKPGSSPDARLQSIEQGLVACTLYSLTIPED